MLELIGSIVLIYYLVLGVALLIFLALGFLDDSRLAKRHNRRAGNGIDRLVQYDRDPEHAPVRQAAQTARLPENVVGFNRRK